MKKIVSIVLAAVALVACTSRKNTAQAESEGTSKYLVLYYSQTGTTKAVAEEIQRLLNADIEAIEAVKPYDGDFNQTVARGQEEMSRGELPELKPVKADLSKYECIFLGYPIWFGKYALPMASLVKNADFAGKKVVPFCTFGSGGLGASVAQLKTALPKADVQDGYGVRTARIQAMPAEVSVFLKKSGFLEGEVPALPEYDAQHPVTEEELQLFNAACGDYQYPLGTPSTVGSRRTATGTDYKFTVPGAQGASVIFVTKPSAEGSRPEFTMVER